ncbi:MAG TPA: zinc ribbon domain-containing protein, partial [Planctomycetota bacterium]|nr:zinc ribbon domain-containing protein [Planctomycetota bacterium]
MRAICEACTQPQPPGWQSGDLCAHCGQAVRREVRCFWCAKWTPLAKFCRSCGAECVEDRLYGAARMIKDAGTDRFTVPKLLRELDPDQLENFTRIYQRQAALVAGHVDQLQYLELAFFHKHWSAELEDQLIPQLPWNDQALAPFALPRWVGKNDLASVVALQQTSPIPVIRELAPLARLLMHDWSAWRDAGAALHSADASVRAEAALVLGSWQVRTACGASSDERAIIDELRRSPFTAAAAVRLAAMSRTPIELCEEVRTSTDPDIAFTVALITPERDRLIAALGQDELHQLAAGRVLARHGDTASLDHVLRTGSAGVKADLMAALAAAKIPAPALNSTLIELVEHTDDERLRERAARVVCYAIPPGGAMRLARAAKGDRSIFQSLLQIANLSADELTDVLAFQIDERLFRMSQYGITEIATKGRLPDNFVPRHFARADHEGHKELCRLAEEQLKARGDEELHRFLYHIVYGDHPGDLRATAWCGLYRWYRQSDPRGEGPLKLEPTAVARFFGSTATFIPFLTAVLSDHATLKE